MKKTSLALVVAVATFLVVPTTANASAGTKCAKAGVVNQTTGLKCTRRKGKLTWTQFYVVPGKPAFVDFNPSSGALSWGNPITWGNPVASFFVVQIRSTVALDWVTATETTINNRSATVSNLVPGVGYEFRVAARSLYGTGEFSNSGLSYVGAGATTTTTTAISVGGASTTTTTIARTTSTTSTTTTTISSITVSQSQASRSAASYLRAMGFSRSGLIKQLQYEGFSLSDATYGADAQNANWSAQAVRVGASYLRSSSFSRSGLIRQLEYEGFSYSDAVYGTDAQNADWFAQAAKTAASYLRSSSFSRSGLINQLLYEGFSQAQAEYGASSVGL